MLFEIRNYHFNPSLFEPYKRWAASEAIPYLLRNLDVVGFWYSTNDPPELTGEPLDRLGSSNVTWIIRWKDLAQRNEVLPRVLSTPEWEDIFSRVPGGAASYLRTEAKFAEDLS
jgi:hypothetical protein